MKFFVGVTDNKWYDFLSRLKPDEVNFWRPSGRGFGAIPVGAPFLFKLHSPLNFIVGGGFFVRSNVLPLSLAWDAFGEKNGAASVEEVRRLINVKRRERSFNPQIGCIILNEPFFLPREYWIPIPTHWSPNIVTGKSYDTSEADGEALWQQVQAVLPHATSAQTIDSTLSDESPRYGEEYLTRARLGQGAFRVLVTEAYGRRCAITCEKTLPVLQAAHIKPFAQSGPNRTGNGLLLRSDLHILFDKGYLTVTPELRVEVSRRIKEEFDNGRQYYPLHGNKLGIVPDVDIPACQYRVRHFPPIISEG